ncbi:MAG: FAD:protein FMN transferase [Chlamydiales bacterium]
MNTERSFFFRPAWVFYLLAALSSCTTPTSKTNPVPTEFADNVMTINYRILVGGALSPSQKYRIQQIIQETFSEVDAIYNKWNPASEISQLNRLSASEWRILSPQLFSFMQRMDQLVKLTEGRFDPTIEPLQELWKNHLENGNEPPEEEIIALKPCIGWDKIQFASGLFYKADSRTQLDLGGIAKGYCVDLLVERLHQEGFTQLYVEWGGEIRTSGYHPEGRPWRVYISRLENPDPHQAIAHLNLINQALATSGDYFQHWTIRSTDGEPLTYCHIFNPKTLQPLLVKPGSIASASLAANDCLTADALAKVLMLFDTPEEAQQWFKKLQETDPHLACWIVTR